jgi:hypothetical protein
MKINIYALPRDDNWSFTAFHYRFYEYLSKNCPSGIELVLKDREIEKNLRGVSDQWHGACKFGGFYTIIENDVTKKYILISFWDRLEDVVYHRDGTDWDYENCVQLLTSTGVHSKFWKFTYTPFTFIPTTVYIENKIEDLYNANIPKVIHDKLKFNGKLYDFRRYMASDNRFNVTEDYYTPDEYFEDLTTHRIALGLPGAAETCNRDVEILGLGNVLLRKKITAKYHNELIPDYHYAAVEYEDIQNEPSDIYWKTLADRYLEKFEQIKNDDEYLNFLAKNGRDWYAENAKIDSAIKLAAKIIDFNKLL